MKVYCFDRDYTVSTSPSPPRMGPCVPIEWVRGLAHQAGYPVIATGNQQLCQEANIPGDTYLQNKYEELPTEIKSNVPAPPEDGDPPTRRYRLRLVEVLFDAESYIVVDDADLSDIENDRWTHYYPWDFVDAVHAGNITIPGINH